MLRELSMSTDASTWDSGESGICTAIWSPSKSALNAVQTSGWMRIALPSTSTGSNTRVADRMRGGARVRRHRRRPLQQHRMLADDFLEHVPHVGALKLHHLLRLLDRRDEAALFELVVDER